MEEIIKPCDYINFNAKNLSFADRVELQIGDKWEVKEEYGRTYVVKKQPKYPLSYEACKIVNALNDTWVDIADFDRELIPIETLSDQDVKYLKIMNNLRKLLNCRDAYWKIAGDWKPKYESLVIDEYFTIHTFNSEIVKSRTSHRNAVLAFPTEEMRDAFYENFKELIKECKELL